MTDVSSGFRPPCWCPSRWAPAWRLHTNLYKFGENVSPRIFHQKNYSDLNLGESLCISILFLFPDSRLNLLKVLIYYFDLFWMTWHWKPAISTRQKFLADNCSEINIQLAGHPICRVEHATSLGLIIDDQLSWSNYIKELCRKISSTIGALRRIRSLISQSTAEKIYNALIQPYLDYCAPVWDGLSSYLCEKLQKLQNRAARVILQANCEVTSSLRLKTLKWDKVSLRRRKQKALMMFKSLNGLAAVYLQDLFSERHTDYDMRDQLRKLNLPKPRTDLWP